jgi:FixJ family two-component response regulator
MPLSEETVATRPKILLVEDNAPVRRALQLLLSANGYEVRSYGGSVGLEQDPEALASDCLIADLVLPDRNAIDLLASLRSHGWNGVSVLVSGHLTPELTSRAHKAGYDAVFAKPLQDAVLVKEIAWLLSTRESGLLPAP